MNISLLDNTTLIQAPHEAKYPLSQVIVIGTIAGFLSVITVIGNIMVMISFKIDKQLQTISNYFLFSLAVADFAIGLISMPLFTIYTLLGYWPLGPFICDTWLALDYLASNASVLNLLIISFDRYFSVTRPLTYRAKRTTERASLMIGCAWGISLLLWPPWIYSWPYIEGGRSVPKNECYIQFIETNHYITFGTAIAAFYVPVTIMCVLYWYIWIETEKRQKDFPNLQAGNVESNHKKIITHAGTEDQISSTNKDKSDWRDHGYDETVSGYSVPIYAQSFGSGQLDQNKVNNWRSFFWKIYNCCVAWWFSGRDDSDAEDTPSEQAPGFFTPNSSDTPLQSSVSRCTSLNVLRDAYASECDGNSIHQNNAASMPNKCYARNLAKNVDATTQLVEHEVSSDSLYTILIRLPGDSSAVNGSTADAASIKMIPEDNNTARDGSVYRNCFTRSTATTPLSTKAKQKPSTDKQNAVPVVKNQKIQKKKKSQEKKADKKAAKTLCAILFTFIITWTPYNVLVLLKPVTSTSTRISPQLWDFFYYLCYINSTINPMCYALCNASFRRTYLRILQCKWHNRNKTAIQRGFYN